MNLRIGTLMAAQLLWVGCGAPSLEEYPGELEDAICEWQHACRIYERKSDCINARTIDRAPRYDYLRGAASAGRVDYDAEAASACLDAIRGRSCEDRYPAEEPACAGVLRGQIGRNGPCMDSAECAGDAICGFDPRCVDQCCVGACRVQPGPLALGEPCGGNTPCVEQGFCGFDAGSGGQVCLARVKAGGDCSNGQTCVEGSRCDIGVCRAQTVAQEGEACDEALVVCAEPARCVYEQDRGQRCRIAPQLGAPCDPRSIGCARFDTFCDEVSRLCVLLPGDGAGCADYRCAEYASCENQTQSSGGELTCVRRGLAGEACGYVDNRYRDCQGELRCDNDVCALPEPGDGEVCPVPDLN